MGEITQSQMLADFRNPPAGYGVVPFYWWLGDPVTKEKLVYHLEQVKDHHISGLQINYAHSDRGGQSFGLTYPGQPEVFSEEWWELLGWFLQEARKRGIAVSLSDYTLGTPGQGYYADWILAENPQMRGCLLERFRRNVREGEVALISAGGLVWEEETDDLPDGWELISAVIRTREGQIRRIDPVLTDGGRQLYMDACGELLLVYCRRKEFSIDPMYPGVGEKYIEKFFGKFEEHFPGECGKGLNFFFSDELNFNIGGNLWNSYFAQEFRRRKGYDIRPCLYLVFEEGCPEAVKVRLDYYDVIVQLEEENYFSKIYQWHEERHMTYGCDHGGRGKDVTEFGDYMRTQKYNQGVGCDQPGLQSDIIKNKVASSISHLYQRSRVWLEGFYGSGWGTSTEQLTDAIARNFVMGHNLLSLHGFYYSTHGGFWEWAPPCNCVRAPYWKDMERLTGAVERMSYLLSRGVHCCRIGIVYPVAAVEGGIDGQKSVDTAFALGEALYRKGLDFDFLDFESIQRAEVRQGRLAVSGESYELVILPAMKTVRGGMYRRLAEAAKKGTAVLAVGGWPVYADSDIAVAGRLLAEKGFLAADITAALSLTEERIARDVRPFCTTEFYSNHRRAAGLDIYMTYGIARGESCFFRGKGSAWLFSPWKGEIFALPAQAREKDGLWLKMPVESSEFPIVVLGEPEDMSGWGEVLDWNLQELPAERRKLPLSSKWDFRLLPTLDNTWGDFELPAFAGTLPCQVKEVHCKERVYKVGYGPFFLYKEEFPDEEAFYRELEAAAENGTEEGWTEYEFSLRWGVEGDPGHQGYHGLKGQLTDDFLRIGDPEKTLTEVRFLPYKKGVGKIFCTAVYSETVQEAEILTGELRPAKLYVNGMDVTGCTHTALKAGWNRVAAGYLECGRAHLVFARKGYEEAACPLAMKWYRMKGMLPFAPRVPEEKRETYWFQAPPALEKLQFLIRGTVEEISAGGFAVQFTQTGNQVTAVCRQICEECCRVEIVLRPENGFQGGAVFDGPVAVSCRTGKLRTGDWSEMEGLKYYSGGASYSQEIDWNPEAGKRVWLEMERVVSTAEVYVNSKLVGLCVAPPWRAEIGQLLRPGKNRIEIRVFNTLGNFYEYLPTRYKSGTESGLIGEVSLYAAK